jgi:ubiquitin-protein ligase
VTLFLWLILVLNVFVLAGTPYAGGVFRVKLALGKDFPQTPPKAFFLTKIFHPNVAKNGEICVNTLKKDWKPDLGIKHILLVCTNISRVHGLKRAEQQTKSV